MALCKFCQKEIIWIKENRRNVPVETDGSLHDCEEKRKTMNSTKKMERSSLSPEEIKQYEAAINLEAQRKKKKV